MSLLDGEKNVESFPISKSNEHFPFLSPIFLVISQKLFQQFFDNPVIKCILHDKTNNSTSFLLQSVCDPRPMQQAQIISSD
jgi:hypothetical protein